MAIFVFLIALSAFTFLFRQTKSFMREKETLSCARLLASSRMEEVRQLPFDALLPLNGATFAEGKGHVAISSLSFDCLEIEVKIEREKPYKSYGLYTLRSKD